MAELPETLLVQEVGCSRMVEQCRALRTGGEATLGTVLVMMFIW